MVPLSDDDLRDWARDEAWPTAQMAQELLTLRGAAALRRGDTVTVYLDDGDLRQRLRPGMVKTLGNTTGPLVVVIDTNEGPSANGDGEGTCRA